MTRDPDVLPDYPALVSVLERCGTRQCPAELHGFALGMTFAGVADPLTVWQQEVYAELDPDDVLAGECRAMLDRVIGAALAAAAPDATLVLLLPHDIEVDARRLSAVRDWCTGFLFGFGLGGETATGRLSAQARELLSDFSEISRLDTEDAENSDANRAALIEVEEYLREGAMIIRGELASTPRARIDADTRR